MTEWGEWRLDKLRELWGQGLSASQIAAILGGGITRNAVVGKAHRMGLAGRPSPIKAGSQKSEVRRQKPKGARPELALPTRAPAPPPLPPREPRVSKRTCCWPIGDPRQPGFRFCAATPVLEGRNYCDEHHAMAFQKRAPHAGAVLPLPRRAG